MFSAVPVCLRDYTKITTWISVKLGWGMGLCPQQTPATFGADPDKEHIQDNIVR